MSPALADYTQKIIAGDLWSRPHLSARDRSIVTLAALIARAQTIGMPHYFNVALDNGVTPTELSEIITHLAFYSGWSSAFFAVEVLKGIYSARGIGPDQLPEEPVEHLPIDEESEALRAATVQENFGEVSQGLVDYTREVVFRDLWLRPGLTARDRSLITVSALVASGQQAQITYHLNRAMDNGLTQAQASEMLVQIAYYSGWPSAFSAMPVVKDVFADRRKRAGSAG
ncbi:carboxymuconolactone decarboxylase family protein [Rhizobium sp. CB3090]|uniref:carboxymuconolactone decarboxylase family protein n=1 Tax=Rhizobium sp. CB3090 TaxID=3039156 RepID=UPI0032C22532